MIMIERMLPYIIPGLIYGIGAIGLALIFRYLRFPDFSVLGSIMIGGVICINVTNLTNPLLGTLAGFLIGGVLGLVTGILIHYLDIPQVLAGIITFTASYSLGYFFTKGGTIEILKDSDSYLRSTFNSKDVLIVLAIALLICYLISFLIKTKPGSLLLAMNADKNFLDSRHRYQGRVIIGTLLFGNAIVGLAGALYALRDHAAHVQTHMDFLPFSLGAIFGGNAVAICIYRIFNKGEVENLTEVGHQTNFKRLLQILSNLVSIERDDSSRIGFLFFIYVLGCLFLQEISGLVNANAFTTIHPALDIPTNSQYLVVAGLIVLFAWLAGRKEE
jgi:putative tryptophan/tyrosine transport system permease protein